MKRFALIFIILILLAGCTNKEPEVVPTTEAVPTVIHIAYTPDSSVEQETAGAVRTYSVSEGVDRLHMMNGGLVLTDAAGQMVMISEESGSVIISKAAKQEILSVQPQNVVSYIPEDGTFVLLDDKLEEIAQYSLEDGMIGMPVAGREEVFYCVGDHIRALSLESGLSRNVMQYVPAQQFLTGSYFGGDLIGWNDGTCVTYLSSKDGQVVFQGDQLLEFETGVDNYYCEFLDGTVQQCIWGTLDGEPMQVLIEPELLVYPQMESKCIITVKTGVDSISFARYNMVDGICADELTVKMPGEIMDIAAGEKYTWFLTTEGLYRWEHLQTKDENAVSCVMPLVSEQNPDMASLEQCAERAKNIGEKYGIDIHIWKDALLNDDSYVIKAEYQVQTINQMLDSVDAQLSLISEQLLKSTDEYCGVQICLVRSIDGHKFVQYRSEAGLCIAVTPEADMEEALLTGLGWGVDSRVIGNSRDLDYWDDLNPAGFEYDYSYFVNEHRTDLDYLEGEYRSFVDKRSMSFPSEDRARIFYYAMTEGNEELFSSPILQTKLRTLCEGIREAYGWQKEPQSFLWEQYLEQSLAYNK